jgi:serine/threonine-protein kinase
MRGFYALAAVSAAVVILVAVPCGGDLRWKHAYQAGAGVFLLNSVGAFLLVGSRGVWRSIFATTHWVVAALALVPAFVYYGPFSAVMLVAPLPLMFVALDSNRTIGKLVLALTLGGHLAVVVPILLGWTTDVGFGYSVAWTDHRYAALFEVAILAHIVGSYALGRWARHTSEAAVAELADARLIIGDQKQVLREVVDRADEVNRVKIGRWTGQTIGPWQLESVLGRGAMGEVYDAHDEQGQAAAVKVLTSGAEEFPTLVERFNRELLVAASLESQHIVKVLDVSTTPATVPYLAMERLDGVDLATILRTRVRLPLGEVVGLLDQVARGLEVAHRAGVVHRDLKPHNLFLHETRCWKILDFGVAKVFGQEGTLTQDLLVGTPQYMAPEQALGERVTPLSDIYALGAIAYRCLTGRAPHDARDLAALVYQVAHGSPARPTTLAPVPRVVEDILAVAMAKDPTQRFTSARVFAESLSAAANGRPLRLQPPPEAWA